MITGSLAEVLHKLLATEQTTEAGAVYKPLQDEKRQVAHELCPAVQKDKSWVRLTDGLEDLDKGEWGIFAHRTDPDALVGPDGYPLERCVAFTKGGGKYWIANHFPFEQLNGQTAW